MIERPAAVVKELIENAIDAGAGRIEVRLEGGGVERIVVTDDGCGMAPEALLLAVERHCTSKLSDETLVRIETLGFRGEALPSIGAAARLCLTSRAQGAAEAWRLRVEGGIVGDLAPCAGTAGTRVLVEDLFFATPARRKFLKSARIETGHAETVLRRLALAAPWIAFSLELDGRKVLDLPQSDRAARVAALLADPGPQGSGPGGSGPGGSGPGGSGPGGSGPGGSGPQGLLRVTGERHAMTLEGFACGPAVHRATASGQFLVVNGRPVADPVLRTAVRVAYRQVIAAGRHPVVALFLTIPPERLDVNVHPAKTELRFADADQVRALVIGSLGRALSEGAGHAGMQPGLRSARGPASSRIWYPPERLNGTAGFAETAQPLAAFSPPAPSLPAQSPPALALTGLPQARVLDTASGTTPAGLSHPLGAAVAQVLDTYVIAVAADGSLVLVDQHAAHERLTHEALAAQFLEGVIGSQRLLLPEVVDLPRGAGPVLLSHAATLARFGLDIEAFGGQSVLVRALPALLGNPDPAALLRDLADELTADELAAPDQGSVLTARLDAVIARMACHGSIRAGRRLQRDEMDALLRRMEATPRAATCSHGRPTYLKLSRHAIEHMFGRA